MAWSYSGDPASSEKDAVRFLIGDTDTDDQQLSDAEINYLIAQWGGVMVSAINAVRGIIARYARLVSKQVGDLSIDYSDRLAAYQALVGQLEAGNIKDVDLYAGGISVSDVQTVNLDTDRVRPAFRRGMNDNLLAGPQNSQSNGHVVPSDEWE